MPPPSRVDSTARKPSDRLRDTRRAFSGYELVSIASLKPDPRNARKHGVKNLEAIKNSLEKFGQQRPIVVTPKGTVVAGNGTLEAAKLLGWDEIAVVRSNLKGKDLRAFALADNRSAELAEWDIEVLGVELKQLALEGFDLDSIGFDPSYVASFDDEKEVDRYTKKIEAPIYEPTGEKPAVKTLVDTAKTKALLSAVDESKAPAAVKEFLRLAAYRHTVFNYEKIAEFYAHADEETQKLFEASALVIIDFEAAIENGFVALSKELAEAYSASP